MNNMRRRELPKLGLAASLPGLTTVVLLAFCGALVSCNSRQTEDPSSDVVRLRDDLRRIAAGTSREVKGQTPPGHRYVLLYGYQGSLESLPISETLRQKLEPLIPYDYERYVLVHAVSDEIKEYTQWEPGNDPLFAPVPFLIYGSPFRIAVEQKERYRVTIKLD
jgi:hypothetical protein